MTVSIIIAGQTFTNSVGNLGLVYNPQTYYITNTSQAASVATQLYGGSASTPAGAITYAADRADISNVNTSGFTTPANWNGPSAYTMFAVVKQPSGAGVALVGGPYNATNSSLSGHAINYVGGQYKLRSNLGTTFGITADNSSNLAFVAIRGNVTAQMAAIDYYGTTGRITNTQTLALVFGTTAPFSAGMAGTGSLPFSIAAFGNYYTYLTDSQINDVYNQVKSDLAQRGVTIL